MSGKSGLHYAKYIIIDHGNRIVSLWAASDVGLMQNDLGVV